MRDEYLASDSKAFEQYKKIQDDCIKFVYYHAFERRRAEEPLEIALAPFEKRVAVAAAALSQVKKDWEYVEKTISLAANTGELHCNQCYGLRRIFTGNDLKIRTIQPLGKIVFCINFYCCHTTCH